MGHEIRKHMALVDGEGKLSGDVELMKPMLVENLLAVSAIAEPPVKLWS